MFSDFDRRVGARALYIVSSVYDRRFFASRRREGQSPRAFKARTNRLSARLLPSVSWGFCQRDVEKVAELIDVLVWGRAVGRKCRN